MSFFQKFSNTNIIILLIFINIKMESLTDDEILGLEDYVTDQLTNIY